MRLKLALMLVGAPTALAGTRFGPVWLFYGGLALLVLALVMPNEPDQPFGDRLKNILRHLPGARWLRPRD